MKKRSLLLLLCLVVLFSPRMIFAKTTTEEDIMNFFSNIQNVQVDDDIIIKNNTITPIKYAFYLYSILENNTSAPYEEKHYYNASLIKKLVDSNQLKTIEDHNTGDTFSIILKEQENQIYQIEYQYNLAGDDAPLINLEEETQGMLLENPNTGNFHFYVTILLIIMFSIGLD